METVRVAAEDAHRQHMEALRQLEENRTAAPPLVLSHNLQSGSGAWRTDIAVVRRSNYHYFSNFSIAS